MIVFIKSTIYHQYLLYVHKANDAILLYNIKHGNIKSKYIKDKIPVNKRVSRNSMHFYPNFSLNKPFEKEPCFRLCTIGNNMIVKKPMLANFDLYLNPIIKIFKQMYYEFFHKK